MEKCTEFAVFKVKKDNVRRAIELSEAIFTEMNGENPIITSHQVLIKTDDPEIICWHLTWVSAEAAKETTAKWPLFPSTKEFQTLIVKDLYYGHFVNGIHRPS